MKRFVVGVDRGQSTLFPDRLEGTGVVTRQPLLVALAQSGACSPTGFADTGGGGDVDRVTS